LSVNRRRRELEAIRPRRRAEFQEELTSLRELPALREARRDSRIGDYVDFRPAHLVHLAHHVDTDLFHATKALSMPDVEDELF
jgi:hypothetical protein